jgi:penicillin-binding protein 2
MRLKIFVRMIIFAFAFLFLGLFYTQVVRHGNYKIMSEENRLRVIPLRSPRGTIYDRNSNVLAKDVLSFNASLVYSQIKDVDALKRMLTNVLEVSSGDVEEGIKRSRQRPYSPVTIAPDIGVEGAIRLEEVESGFPGVFLDVSTKREYTNGRSTANFIGYLGLLDRYEFDKLKNYGYKINDLVGKSGLEKQYDNYLRGTNGGKQLEVDHIGREIAVLGYKEPVQGKDICLTIDRDLQDYCYEISAGKRGAILVMDPRNGAILAMVSVPTYDPEVFIDPRSSAERKELFSDKKYPMMNRGISGSYPPGSVFKLVVATGALEAGKATEWTSAVCAGALNLGGITFHCWRKDGHGEQNLPLAIKNSCNVYFYRLGLLLGVDDIARFAQKLGFGETSGIDIPGEVPGVVPSKEWKRKHFNDNWYKGETVNYAIGQGYLLVTPIQIARMAAVFGNKGYLVRPHLVSRIGTVDVGEYGAANTRISKKTLDVVREGMRKCVNDPGGTGCKAIMQGVTVAGKTGTAQTTLGISHGWFAGFAPFDDAKLVVVVFDEYGGKGGYYAAGTAGEVFRKAKELGLI